MKKLGVVTNIFQNETGDYCLGVHVGIDDGSEYFDDTRSVYHESFKIPYMFNDDISRRKFEDFIKSFCAYRFEKEI